MFILNDIFFSGLRYPLRTHTTADGSARSVPTPVQTDHLSSLHVESTGKSANEGNNSLCH